MKSSVTGAAGIQPKAINLRTKLWEITRVVRFIHQSLVLRSVV